MEKSWGWWRRSCCCFFIVFIGFVWTKNKEERRRERWREAKGKRKEMGGETYSPYMYIILKQINGCHSYFDGMDWRVYFLHSNRKKMWGETRRGNRGHRRCDLHHPISIYPKKSTPVTKADNLYDRTYARLFRYWSSDFTTSNCPTHPTNKENGRTRVRRVTTILRKER